MNKIFIIGAGASRELQFISHNMDITGQKRFDHFVDGPISNGFFFAAKQFVGEVKKSSIFSPDIAIKNDWLVTYIKNYYLKKYDSEIDIEELFSCKAKSYQINIEQLFIDIEETVERIETGEVQSYSPEFIHAYLGREELLKYIHYIFAIISYYCYSLLHRELASYILKQGADVISFNWDTLLDDEMFSTGDWDYSYGYGFEPKAYIDKNLTLSNEYHYKPSAKSSRSLILKPHGSINWYCKTKSGGQDEGIYIGIPLIRQGALRGGTTFYQGQVQYNETVLSQKEHYRSLVLPPGRKRIAHLKIWEIIESVLKNADEIIAIGFSFNSFDDHITNIFKTLNLKRSVQVRIVNPDEGIVERYQDVFESENIVKVCNTFSEYCKTLK